jgi:PAS domain S-box-containing protein
LEKIIRNRRPAAAAILLFYLFFPGSRVRAFAPKDHAGEGADEGLRSKKVLILHSNNAFIPANRIVDGAIVPALNAAGIPTSSIYGEYFDSRRFRNGMVPDEYISYLREFYASLKIDLVIINEESTLDFVARYGQRFLPDVPVVLCAVSAGAPIPDFLKGRVTGSLKKMDAGGNIIGIMALQPGVREIAVLVGSGEQDVFFEQILRKELRDNPPPLRIIMLKDRPLPELLSEISGLGSQSALLALSFFRDSAGGIYNPGDVVDMVVRRSPVPVYGISDTYLDTGFVGGNLMSFRDLGADAAARAVSILRGEPFPQPPMSIYGNRYYYDWRKLVEWHIPLSRVPAGSVILNQPPGAWSVYRSEIILTLVLFFSCVALIITLTFQLKRRRRAEKQVLESGHLLDRILQTTPAVIFIYNLNNYSLEYVNRRLFMALGYPVEMKGSAGREFFESFIHPEDLGKMREALKKIRESGIGVDGLVESEYRARHRDGGWRWVHSVTTGFSFLPEGAVEKILVSVIDITEKKQREMLVETTLEEKKALLRELYHRTKNNMNVIHSLLNLYMPSLRDDVSRAIFSDMSNRIQAMSLVHQKLYESGNLSAIKIGEYVHDLTGLLCRGIGTGAGSVNFELETGDTELSINEAIPLGLILNELVSNSVKHGRRDDLNISIFTRVTGEGFLSWNTGITGGTAR